MSRERAAEFNTGNRDRASEKRRGGQERANGYRNAPLEEAKFGAKLGSGRHPLLRLQERYGNQIVQRAVRERVHSKSEVGEPNDRYEREAKRMANRIVRSPESSPRRRDGDDGASTASLESDGLRREPAAVGSPSETESNRNSSTSVPESVRTRTESYFGTALDDVQIHRDAESYRIANALDAQAFTVGRHIYFGEGYYQPGTAAGRGLLAHELTHTVQQRTGRVTNTVQRQEVDTETKISRLIADEDDEGIQTLTDEELSVATPQQRAGMVRVLTDLWWTSEAEERTILRLLRFRGQHRQVIAALDAIGYRQRVIDAVDSERFATELQALVADVEASSTGESSPISRALAAGEPEDVMAVQDYSQATVEQRLGLLRILLEMGSSNKAEEATIVRILASSGDGLAETMQSLTQLGLKQDLFDHIDDEENKQQLTALLTPLNDPELNADLAVFNRGFFGNLWEGITGGVSIAWENLTFAAIVMGLLQPIIHPIDTLVHLFEQINEAVEQPSLDTVVTALRDVAGTLGIWFLTLAGIFAALAAAGVGIGVLLAETGVGAIAGGGFAAWALGMAEMFFAWAGIAGIAFIVLAIVKGVIDLFQVGTATTARELEREQEQVAEDVTILGVVLLFIGIFKIVERIIVRLRDIATKEDQATPEGLREVGEEAKAAEGEGKQEVEDVQRQVEELEQRAEQGREGDVTELEPVEEPSRPVEEPSRPVEEPPRAAPDPFDALAAKYDIEPDVISVMRDSGVSAERFDSALAAGGDPITVALVADYFGTPGVRLVEQLIGRGVPAEEAVRTVEEAGAEFGGRGVEIVEALVAENVSYYTGLEILNYVDVLSGIEPRLPAWIYELTTSGRLRAPERLLGVLKDAFNEAASSDPSLPDRGSLREIEIAATAEGQVEFGGGGDVVVHQPGGASETIQSKSINAPTREGMPLENIARSILRNIVKAAAQLRGEYGEVPPEGSIRVIGAKLQNPENPFYNMDRAGLLEALRRDVELRADDLQGVDELRVTNGHPDSPHSYTPAEFP